MGLQYVGVYGAVGGCAQGGVWGEAQDGEEGGQQQLLCAWL